ncbi:MAG: IS1380 family transposase, partial [Epsilonproteobacteria bacterium]|nr:IS1380 family transposase [Campylobacterota bacterium]
MDKTDIIKDLESVNLPYPRSNAGYNPIDIVQGFWLSIFTGASRYIHADWLRYDTTLQEIFDIKRLPSQATYSRFFHKFSWQKNNEVFPELQRKFLEQIDVGALTIDLDSSVITRYGHQEGAKKGYNPKKMGRNSHHPLMAFIDQTKMVANAWMRSGNTADLNNYENFLNETFDIALKDKEIGLVRADSGFYSNGFLQWFEKRAINYVIAVKFYENIKYRIGAITDWTNITYGLDVCSMTFKPDNGEKRRYIIVRKKLSKYPNSGGKLLFDEPTYRYSAYVTNLKLPVDQIYNIYNSRADCENRIKELKYDFGADNFCLKEFFATEASFRFIMMAYNVMAL